MTNINYVGDGKVVLIAGGGKTYSDIAAKFCRSSESLEDIIATPQNKELLIKLVNSPHKAAIEFDNFIFGVTGYSRVTEIQLVRKRHASYLISSGRIEKNGKRTFDMTLPRNIIDVSSSIELDPSKIKLKFDDSREDLTLASTFPVIRKSFAHLNNPKVFYEFDSMDILNIIEQWYNTGVENNIPEEDLRYLKPQATSFKAIISMNATALRDWAAIRMCFRAQKEIRDLCTKMIRLASEAAPELMDGVGPNCKILGYCPEIDQCKHHKGKVPTKEEALEILKNNYGVTSK